MQKRVKIGLGLLAIGGVIAYDKIQNVQPDDVKVIITRMSVSAEPQQSVPEAAAPAPMLLAGGDARTLECTIDTRGQSLAAVRQALDACKTEAQLRPTRPDYSEAAATVTVPLSDIKL